ncbi:MAG: hypothetical protein ABIJ46_00955 [bacterium]
MRKSAFAGYCGVGLVVLFSVCVLLNSLGNLIWPCEEYVQFERDLDQYHRNYVAWERDCEVWERDLVRWRQKRNQWHRQRTAWQQWPEHNAIMFQQRHFEEALAGVGSVEAIEEEGLRNLAEAIILLMRPVTHIESEGRTSVVLDERSRALFVLLSSPQEGPLLQQYLIQASVLLAPERLARLLGGDATVIKPTLPSRPNPPQHPNPLRDRPVEPILPILSSQVPAFGPLPYQDSPYWWLIVWATTSIVFMGGFVGCGLILYLKKKNQEFHPLRSFPNFIFGWLVMVAAAPGWIVFQIFRLLFSDFDPIWLRIRRRFNWQTEEEKRFDFLGRLEEIKVKAEEQGNRMLADQAEGLILRARDRGSKETLAALKGEADNIGLALDGLDEADRV